jgi:hypothetical protein
MTILNYYPLLLIKKLIDGVQGTKLLLKIDLKLSHNLIKFEEEDE